jgi:hypothetical protein
MNLFIGLLNLAIGDYNKEEEFLLQKAKVTIFFTLLININFFFINKTLHFLLKIIMEIELFYMLPYQRRNKKWFPDWM